VRLARPFASAAGISTTRLPDGDLGVPASGLDDSPVNGLVDEAARFVGERLSVVVVAGAAAELLGQAYLSPGLAAGRACPVCGDRDAARLTSSPPRRTGIPRAKTQAAWWLTLPDRSGLPRPVTASPAARILSAAFVSALPCQAHRSHRKLAWLSRFPALTCWH